jgi:hypothetical protein
MKAAAVKYPVILTVATLISVILVLIPFHAFLTVWLASHFGHYTALRLWKEVLLAVCALGALYLLLTDIKIRSHTLSRRLVWLIVAYCLLQLGCGLLALRGHAVTAKALGYGLIINTRFLIFFLFCWAAALRTARLHKNWQKLLLWPALVVIVFGLLQALVLPNDFLRHFGYGPATILPFETINHNAYYARIQATLRGSNPLGAYLVVPLSVLSVLIVRGQRNWQRIALLLAGLVVLFFTFSRSAWLGSAIAVGLAVILGAHSAQTRRRLAYLGLAGLVALAGLGLALRHNTRVQNVTLHTESHTTAQQSSNQGHLSALSRGVSDIVHNPFGTGTGTAGPASVYNNHQSRIAENYFLQIGQESGLFGLLLFVLITGGVGYLLWMHRADPLALSLFASLIGLTVINLLSHAWTDDTLAYVWWGFAGVAMAPRAILADRIKPADQ